MRCALALYAMLALAAPAAAQETDEEQKETCANAFEAAQDRRAEGRLKHARDEVGVCAATCPPVLAEKCQTWRGEIEAAIPSVVMRARAKDGRELSDVMVRIDGGAAQPLTSDAVELDPGLHTFSFERRGSASVSKQFTLEAGTKEAPVVAELSVPPLRQRRSAARRRSTTPEAGGGGPPLATWLLGAAGIAALGVGAALAIVGHVRRAEALEPGGCSPLCSDAEVASIRDMWIAGGVTGGVGLVLAVTAGVVWQFE